MSVCITPVILQYRVKKVGFELVVIVLKVRLPRILLYSSTGPIFIHPSCRIEVDPVTLVIQLSYTIYRIHILFEEQVDLGLIQTRVTGHMWI